MAQLGIAVIRGPENIVSNPNWAWGRERPDGPTRLSAVRLGRAKIVLREF
jgi:hypothetical protein